MGWHQFNAACASLVMTFGLWLIWPDLSSEAAVAIGVVLALMLAWKVGSIVMIWVWATGVLGLESLAWPLFTMWQARGASPTPTPEQMGTMLNAIIGGLLSSIFWLTFSYGLYSRLGKPKDTPSS